MENYETSTNLKALSINLEPSTYGVFAEIGGGQEVARNFFLAGAASGTIAKTISAYDKQYSDALYSDSQTTKRYVSEHRLDEMLATEYAQLTGTLEGKRDKPTRFFVFADTVSTINYRKDNVSHGWMGVQFQLQPEDEANKVVMHVSLFERDNSQQQATLGILGVNLLYACYNFHDRPNSFLLSLMDNLSKDRLAITMIRMSGPQLSYVDNRLLGVQLVKNGVTDAIMFDRSGNVQEPGDMLYKKNIIAIRGTFRPITNAGADVINAAYDLFRKDEDFTDDNTLSFCEITLNNILTTDESETIDERDFLARVDILNALGQNVMVSNFREFYKLVRYFSHFSINKLRLVIGVRTFEKVFDRQYYRHLKGGILEAFGYLFPENMKMYVYPSVSDDGLIQTSADLKFEPDIAQLYQYLKVKCQIMELKPTNPENMQISSDEVLELIEARDPQWECMVPQVVEGMIKEQQLFGYQSA